jgi:starvation-inducible DNA-binding protein
MPRTNHYRPENGLDSFQPNIGLEASARASVIEMLNLIVADEAVLALKTGRADGLAVGVEVPELQTLFDDQSKQIAAISSEMTERVQILGGSHTRSSAQLTDSARLGREINASPGIVSILADHEAFIRFLREDAQKCSELYEDQGTYVLLINTMRIHEKMAWVLRSNIALEKFD